MSEKHCTWEACESAAKHPCRAQDGEVWADLCDEHKAKFDAAPALGAKAILGTWVKAQGGAKAAAQRMTRGR